MFYSEVMASSMSIQAFRKLSDFGIITMELSTEDVETIKEVPSYTVFDFLSDVCGNVGMFFGLSLLKTQFSEKAFIERYF